MMMKPTHFESIRQWLFQGRRTITVVVTGLLGACAGNGSGLDSSGRPLSEGGSASGTVTASFSSIQANVFSPICTACHAGAGAPVGLRLDEANSYSLLVGVPSSEAPALLRIKAGDPDNSYLVQKLEGRASVGAQMPLGGPSLPTATISAIRQWIAAGAVRTAGEAGGLTAEALAVTTTYPEDGELVDSSRPAIVLAFSQSLDVTRVSGAAVTLQRLDPPGDFAAGLFPQVPVAVAAAAANSQAIVISPRQPLEAGWYRVAIDGQPGNELTDLGGHRVSGVRRDAGGAGEAMIFEVRSAP